MNVLFEVGHLGERGTMVAQYDYAHYNETILGNKSFIAVHKEQNHPAKNKFESRFPVAYLDYKDFNLGNLTSFCLDNKIDVVHQMVPGNGPAVMIPSVKNCVHLVFDCRQPFGDAYAAVSYWLAKNRSNGSNVPVVPHMIDMPNCNEDMREELGIPRDAIVFGRYGGNTEFNIPFVHSSIEKVVKRTDNIWFLFANTDKFCEDNKRVIHLDKIIDTYDKAKFINTCDAMLHGRQAGETFGLAVGEFAIMGKHIITWSNGVDLAHLDILGESAIVYNDESDLISILEDLEFYMQFTTPCNAYSEIYNPQNVMKMFDEIFIKENK